MNEHDRKLLTDEGWTITGENPLYIIDSQGSYASGSAAQAVLDGLHLYETIENAQKVLDRCIRAKPDGPKCVALEDAIMGEPSVGDRVAISMNRTGIITEVRNQPWGHPYEVQIIESNFGDVGEYDQFSRDQIRVLPV